MNELIILWRLRNDWSVYEEFIKASSKIQGVEKFLQEVYLPENTSLEEIEVISVEWN